MSLATLSTKTDMTVANEIAHQIGGRAFFMLGTNSKVGDHDSLTFNVRGSKVVNRVKVALSHDDTYALTFYKIGRAPGYVVNVVAEHTGVYANNLNTIIERETGLWTSLAATAARR